MRDWSLTATEREYLFEAVTSALVECEESEDISQGVIDNLLESIRILGAYYDL